MSTEDLEKLLEKHAPPDMPELEEFMRSGKEAWKDVPDAAQWVREIRGELPQGMIVVPKELFDWLVEYAIYFRSEEEWKKMYRPGSRKRTEYDELNARVEAAIKLRDQKPENEQ